MQKDFAVYELVVANGGSKLLGRDPSRKSLRNVSPEIQPAAGGR